MAAITMGVRDLTCLTLLALAGVAVAQEPVAPPGAPKPQQPTTLDLLEQQLREQQARLIEDQARLDELARRIEALRELQREPGESPPPIGPPPPSAAAESQGPEPQPEEQRPEKEKVAQFTEQDPAKTSKEEYAEVPDPLIGDFPGSIKIPGTHTSLKVGGFVKLNFVHSWDAIGSTTQFSVPSIPVAGTPEASEGPRTAITARESRISLDVRKASGDGYLRAYVETDFAGGAVGSDLELLRLRHAFGQYDRRNGAYVLAGKTWTTFMDPSSLPDSIDFEGVVGAPFKRQALARYAQPIGEPVLLSLSIENPEVEVTGGEGINDWPDFATSLRWSGDWGHLQVAGVLRRLEAQQTTTPSPTERTGGWGVSASGRVKVDWYDQRDGLRFSFSVGEGIGSYINGTASEGGQDAVFDPTLGTLVALPVLGAHGAFEHWFSDTVRTNLVFSYNRVVNSAGQASDSYHEGYYSSVNLLWSITPDIVLGVEQLYGVRVDKDLDSGAATQTQVAVKFLF